MAFPARLATIDDFNRSNGALTSPWVAVTGRSTALAVSSNRVVVNANDALMLHTGVSIRHGYVALTRAGLSGSTTACVAIRATADGRSGYVWEAAGTFSRLYRLDTDGTVGSSRTTTAWAAGDIMVLVASGSTLECWRSRAGTPTLLFSESDTTFTTGYAGVGGDSSGSNQGDDFCAFAEAAVPVVLTHWCGVPGASSVEVVATVDDGARGRLIVSTRSDLSSPITGAEATRDGQGVLRLAATGLAADTHYYRGIAVDGVTLATGLGEFRTAPSTAASFTFAFASCWHPGAFETPVWGRIETAAPSFMLQIGDLGYPDDYGIASPAGFRASYDRVLGRAVVASMLETVPMWHVWDDHDFGGDDSWSGSSPAADAQQVFREREPLGGTLPSASGIYRTFVWGRCRFILLDSRSHRDHHDDTDDASKTMLGAAQISWLEGVLRAATEPAIFVVTSVPWNDSPRSAEDGWGRYQTEQAALVASWRSLGVIGRIVMLSGDAHMLAADDGTNSPGGIPALQAAPMAANASIKGGTFSQGTHGGREQFGLITVTDSGSAITVRFAGVTDDGSTAITHTTVLAEAAPARRRMLLLGVG